MLYICRVGSQTFYILNLKVTPVAELIMADLLSGENCVELLEKGMCFCEVRLSLFEFCQSFIVFFVLIDIEQILVSHAHFIHVMCWDLDTWIIGSGGDSSEGCDSQSLAYSFHV